MLKFTVHTELSALDAEAFAKRCERAETVIATEIMKDTAPFVPMLTGSLNQRTQVVGNKIIYPGPYSRYLYYGKKMVDAATGNGPANIPDVGPRFRKGAVLKATEKDLVYTTDFHQQAQSSWFEASKAQNLQKWIDKAKKTVTSYGK